MSDTASMLARKLVPALIGPFDCSSLDCNEQAEFFVDLPAEWLKTAHGRPGHPRKVHDEWARHFCKSHLLRALDVQLDDIHNSPLRVRRIR